jgi:hypothetical protein
MKGRDNMNTNIQDILATIFRENVDTFRDEQARAKIGEYIGFLKNEGYDMNYCVFVKDTMKSDWQNEAHFFKVFYDEIDYAMSKYKLKQNDIDFLLRLGRYLKWEMNLIVDESDSPLNQKELAKALNMNIRTLQRSLIPLIENKLIYSIEYGRNNFYLVNPYVMFIGKNINVQIPHLFDTIGYVRSKRDEKLYRYKKVSKRTEIQPSNKNKAVELTCEENYSIIK